MNLYEYNGLTVHEKAQELWDKGHHIASIVVNQSSFVLYSLGDFYVEIELKSDNQIHELVSFKKGILFEKYLDQVDIQSLFDKNMNISLE